MSLAVACAAALLSVSGFAAHDTAAAQTYSVTSQITLPTAIPSFDIVEINPQLGLLAVADKGVPGIDIINIFNNKLVVQFGGFVAPRTPGDSGANGVVFVDNKEIWGGDGNSTVRVYDLASQSLRAVIPIPNGTPLTRTDEGCYDPINKVALFANDRDLFVSFISTTTYTVLSQIRMNGTVNGGSGLAAPNATNGIEQCRFNPRNGLIYQNIPQENGNGTSGNAPGATVVYNGATRSIVTIFRYPLSSCSNPTGMAVGPVGPGGGQIMLACTNTGGGPGVAIINDTNGNVIANFPNDFGADEITYDSGNGKYILGEGSHTPLSQIGIIDAFSLTSTPLSLGVAGEGTHTVAADPIFNQLYTPVSNSAAAQANKLCSSHGGNDALGCILVSTPGGATTALASILPNARTTTTNTTVTAFATIANAGTATATNCSIALPGGVPATFLYQTTNPVTNQPTGTANTPVSIAPGQSQSFYFAVTPTSPFALDLRLVFGCTNTAPAPTYPGLNTFRLSAPGPQLPDMLSISDTLTHDGNIVVPPLSDNAALMVTAAVNIAAAGTVTFTPTDTPPGEFPRGLPVVLSICQTNANAICVASPSPSVTLNVAAGQTVTFAVIVTPTGGDPSTVPYIPAFNRIFLVATQNGTPVGMTSAAVKMQ